MPSMALSEPVCLNWLHCHNNIPQAGRLKQQKFIFSQSGGWKPQIKVPRGMVHSESCLPGLQVATFSLCPHKAERKKDFLGGEG